MNGFKLAMLAGLGGFFGTCCRYLTGRLSLIVFNFPMPYGIFMINMIGCFIIGILYGLVDKKQRMSKWANVFLITGFCGGFTTFSDYQNDMNSYLLNGEVGHFIVYLFLTFVGGFLLVWLGQKIIRNRKQNTTTATTSSTH